MDPVGSLGYQRLRAAIIDMLRCAGQPLSKNQIRGSVSGANTTIDQTVEDLENEGILRSQAKSNYRVYALGDRSPDHRGGE